MQFAVKFQQHHPLWSPFRSPLSVGSRSPQHHLWCGTPLRRSPLAVPRSEGWRPTWGRKCAQLCQLYLGQMAVTAVTVRRCIIYIYIYYTLTYSIYNYIILHIIYTYNKDRNANHEEMGRGHSCCKGCLGLQKCLHIASIDCQHESGMHSWAAARKKKQPFKTHAPFRASWKSLLKGSEAKAWLSHASRRIRSTESRANNAVLQKSHLEFLSVFLEPSACDRYIFK